MRAVAVEAFGQEPAVTEVPVREPGPGEVLVRVQAASVNPLDWQVAAGALAERAAHRFPFVLGFDAAGRVEAVGPGAGRFAVGDAVFGQFWSDPLGEGTFAEYVTAPEQMAAGALMALPAGLDATTAAALPTAAMTALGAVGETGVGAGDTILIIGASGGVGSVATRLAAQRGAHVIATARPDAAARLRDLGAEETIDYGATAVADALAAAHPDGIDAVLDLVGDPATVAAVAAHVRDGGTAISIAFGVSSELAADARITARNYLNQDKPALLARVAEAAAAGRLGVDVAQETTLEGVPAALGALRQGGSRGKTVVRVAA